MTEKNKSLKRGRPLKRPARPAAAVLSLLLLFCLTACGAGAPAVADGSREAAVSSTGSGRGTEAAGTDGTETTPDSSGGPAASDTEEAAQAGDTAEGSESRAAISTEDITETEETAMEKKLRLSVGGEEVAVNWEDNESVRALAELAADGPLTVQMSMYGGFEQVGPLGADLPRQDQQTTTEAGDIVLYSGDQIVIFYGSNSWAYTRLGRAADRTAAQMAELLGHGDVALTITAE